MKSRDYAAVGHLIGYVRRLNSFQRLSLKEAPPSGIPKLMREIGEILREEPTTSTKDFDFESVYDQEFLADMIELQILLGRILENAANRAKGSLTAMGVTELEKL